MLWLRFQQLKSKNAATRKRVAEKLGQSEDARAIAPLVAALKDRDQLVRETIKKALNSIDPNWPYSEGAKTAVHSLVLALKDSNSEVRKAALKTLAEIKDKRAWEPIAITLKNKHAWWDLRIEVAEVMGEIMDKRALEPLIAALVDMPETAVKTLMKIDPNWMETEEAKASVPLLLLALEHENIAAAEALGTIADAKAVDPLIAALNCRSSTMRKVAAKSLGQIKDKRAVEPLVKLLADKKSEVQEAAMNALVNFDLTVVLPSLLLALKEKKHEVRYAAEKVIGMFGDPRAVEPLATMLGNKNLDILARLAALRALGQIDDVRSLEPLVAELVNKDISLHKAAIETLGLRKGSVSALGQSRRLQLVEVLIRVLTDLKDPDCGVRNIAAEILGEIGDKTSVSAKLNYCEII